MIGSAFSIAKPAATFDGEGVYRLAGNLRHRGLEVSLSGQLTQTLRILAGATLLDAQRSGELVDLGTISARMPGLSRFQGLLGLSWSVPGVDQLTLDSQFNHWTSRRVRSRDDLTAPSLTTLDVGATQRFRLAGADMSLRLRVTNLLDTDRWIANRSETLDRVSRRAVRLSLTARMR